MNNIGITTSYGLARIVPFDTKSIDSWLANDDVSIRPKNCRILDNIFSLPVGTFENYKDDEEVKVESAKEYHGKVHDVQITRDAYWRSEKFINEAIDAYRNNKTLSDKLAWTEEDDKLFASLEVVRSKNLFGSTYTVVHQRDPNSIVITDYMNVRKRYYNPSADNPFRDEYEKAVIIAIANKKNIFDYVLDSLYIQCDVRRLMYGIFPLYNGQVVTSKFEAEDIYELFNGLALYDKSVDNSKVSNNDDWIKFSSYLRQMLDMTAADDKYNKNTEMSMLSYGYELVDGDELVNYERIKTVLADIWYSVRNSYLASVFINAYIRYLDYHLMNCSMSSDDIYRLVDIVGDLTNKSIN